MSSTPSYFDGKSVSAFLVAPLGLDKVVTKKTGALEVRPIKPTSTAKSSCVTPRRTSPLSPRFEMSF